MGLYSNFSWQTVHFKSVCKPHILPHEVQCKMESLSPACLWAPRAFPLYSLSYFDPLHYFTVYLLLSLGLTFCFHLHGVLLDLKVKINFPYLPLGPWGKYFIKIYPPESSLCPFREISIPDPVLAYVVLPRGGE